MKEFPNGKFGIINGTISAVSLYFSFQLVLKHYKWGIQERRKYKKQLLLYRIKAYI